VTKKTQKILLTINSKTYYYFLIIKMPVVSIISVELENGCMVGCGCGSGCGSGNEHFFFLLPNISQHVQGGTGSNVNGSGSIHADSTVFEIISTIITEKLNIKVSAFIFFFDFFFKLIFMKII
jgi:hypothetical protein